MSLKNKTKIYNKSYIMLICTFLLMFIIGIWTVFVFAKYQNEYKDNEQLISSKQFYFSSDLLDDKEHTIATSTTTTTVEIILMNHLDELRYSSVDINYEVVVKDYNTNLEVELPIINSSGVINSGDLNDVTISISGLEPGKKYLIEATSKTPYQQVLTGVVNVQAIDLNLYTEISTKGNVVELKVSTVDYSGKVLIKYGSGLVPDNTDSMMNDWQSGEQTKEVMFTSYYQHVFRFFVVNSDTSIIVTKGE